VHTAVARMQGRLGVRTAGGKCTCTCGYNARMLVLESLSSHVCTCLSGVTMRTAWHPGATRQHLRERVLPLTRSSLPLSHTHTDSRHIHLRCARLWQHAPPPPPSPPLPLWRAPLVMHSAPITAVAVAAGPAPSTAAAASAAASVAAASAAGHGVSGGVRVQLRWRAVHEAVAVAA
jgi:hypothetical protein